MKTASLGITARHSHLIRAAQSAGEAFACCTDESFRRRSAQSLAAWIGVGAFAALALFVAL
jgi:hypothetical protein